MSVDVQNTAIDAAVSKISSRDRGYFTDPYLDYFVPANLRKPRSPLINRGYYARHVAFRAVVRDFLASTVWGAEEEKQIVSLGGGSETIYFRLFEGKECEVLPKLYVEVDMTETALGKARTVAKHPALVRATGGASLLGSERLSSDKPSSDLLYQTASGYHIVACDLTDLDRLRRNLEAVGVDPTKPTLFLSECVLVYVDPRASGRLIEWASKSFSKSAFCTYEQIRPDDAFGQMMVQNLKRRGVELKGLVDHPSLESQELRFQSRGWSRAKAVSMKTVYFDLLPKKDRERVERLEIFDEFEEFYLIMEHYALTLAVNAPAASEEENASEFGHLDLSKPFAPFEGVSSHKPLPSGE